MDLTVPDRPLRRMAWGALEGAALGALAYGVVFLLHFVAEPSWRGGLLFVAAGIAGGILSQYVARGILGACGGVVVGVLLGFAIGDDFIRPTLARPHLNQPAKVSGVTVEGKPFNIDSYRGNVVLVDFWATWCPTCLEDVSLLKSLYDRFHDDGLEIVGVSLDSSKEKLASFVERENIRWPQLYPEKSDEKGWDNPLINDYSVHGIPYTLLIDRQGTIIASGLIGPTLEEAVEKVMAGEKPPHVMMADLQHQMIVYLAAVGCLAGILVERRLRHVLSRPMPESRP